MHVAPRDELAQALAEVTFCVVDLETTGTSPAHSTITEVGALTVRGGVREGSFHALVGPEACGGLPLGGVLAALLEFAGGGVLVGHNVRFDLAFLHASLVERDYPPLANRTVDTLALARRLVGDEVADRRLHTLAAHLGLPHRPTHRAFDDALATADLLHALLERAGSLGIDRLADLLALPSYRGAGSARLLKLTARLPTGPGVFVFRDEEGAVLHVGSSADVRTGARSHFATGGPRLPRDRLRRVAAVEAVRCAGLAEAAIFEAALRPAPVPRARRKRPARRVPDTSGAGAGVG